MNHNAVLFSVWQNSKLNSDHPLVLVVQDLPPKNVQYEPVLGKRSREIELVDGPEPRPKKRRRLEPLNNSLSKPPPSEAPPPTPVIGKRRGWNLKNKSNGRPSAVVWNYRSIH